VKLRRAGRALLHHAAHHRLEEPEIGIDHALHERHGGCEAFDHAARRAIHPCLERIVANPLQRAGKPSDGCLRGGRGHGGMPAFGIGDDIERHRSLLGHADHRHGRVHAGQQPLAEDAAFIRHPGELGAAFLQQGGKRLVAFAAAYFLVMAEGEHDGARRLEALRGEHVGSFHDGDQ